MRQTENRLLFFSKKQSLYYELSVKHLGRKKADMYWKHRDGSLFSWEVFSGSDKKKIKDWCNKRLLIKKFN
jgi:hypothetical protein